MDTKQYIAVLLGAGASAAFGVPTMKSMVTEFERVTGLGELKELHAKKDWHQVKLKVKQSDLPNIEYFLHLWYYLFKANSNVIDLEGALSQLEDYRLFMPSNLLDFLSRDPIFVTKYLGDFYSSLKEDEQAEMVFQKMNNRTAELRLIRDYHG